MKAKHLILIAGLSFLVDCLLGILRGYASFMASSLAGYIIYFFLTIYLVRKNKSAINDFLILLALLLGLSIIEIPIRFLSWESTLVSLPDLVIHYAGILTGFIYAKSSRIIGIGVAVIGLASSLFLFFGGYELWLNKLNYGTFTGNVMENAPEFKLSRDGEFITNESLKDKMIVLDFWHTACGVCFKKFPELQKKYDKYKCVKGLNFYAVNIHIKRDSVNQAINTIRKLKYTFPVIVVDDDTLIKRFKVSSVPMTVIIYNGTYVLYRGDVESVDKTIEDFINKRYVIPRLPLTDARDYYNNDVKTKDN